MQASIFSTIIFILFLIGILLLTACTKKTSQPPTTAVMTQEEKVQQLGEQLFKKDFSIDYNKEKTVVCIAKTIKKRPNDIFTTLSFVLYQPESAETLFKEVIPRATGKWLNNTEFEVITIPGRLPGRMPSNTKGTQKSGFIYNVKTKIKRKI